MNGLPRRALAELLGTLVLVFVGCGAVIMNNYPGTNLGLLGVAVAQGLAFGVAVTATMAISGGHLNPAITLALLVGRRVAPRDAAAYVVAQLLGGVLGAFLVKLVVPSGAASAALYGTPTLNAAYTVGSGILLEALLTFLLVSAVYGTIVAPEAPKVGGFGAGLMLTACILAGGPLSGGVLNPARAFGPALAAGNFTAQAVWWVGPVVGGVVAGLVWGYLLLPKRA